MNEVFLEYELKMKQVVEHFHGDLKQLRTGRASLAILDGVTVEYYGTPTPLNQVANLSVADANMIVAQPYDATLIGGVEKAIMTSDLGLNPSNDGKIVRIPIPPLTGERRQELVRKAHDMAESSRNGIRGVRREANEILKMMEREKEISQDDERRGHDEVQKLHDHYIGQVNQGLATKEKDIMEI